MLIPLNKGHIQISSQSKGESKRASRMMEWSEIWMENGTALLVKFFHKPTVWHGIKWPHLQSERWGSDRHKAVSGPVILFFLNTQWLQSDSQHRQSFTELRRKAPPPGQWAQFWAVSTRTLAASEISRSPVFPKCWSDSSLHSAVSSQQMLKDHPWKGVSPKRLIITSTED